MEAGPFLYRGAMHSFVLVYYGNSGSSWLIEAIGGGPDVLIPAFEPLESWAWKTSDRDKADWIRAVFNPPQPLEGGALDSWLAEVRKSPQFVEIKKTRFSHVGFKMTASAFKNRDVFFDVIDETDSRLVFLRRSNRIKHALSFYRYHEEKKSQFDHAGIRPPSQVDLRKFDKWLKSSVSLDDELVALTDRARERFGEDRVAAVAYEDFVDDAGKQAVLERLTSFLGIPKPATSVFKKATPDDLRRAVVNYRELQKHYRKTPYAVYFD